MKKIKLFLLLTVMCYNYSTAQNFNKIAGKAIKKAIGSDLRGYQIFSYPTDNFGLITSYENRVDDKNFICDMWNCIGISTVPTNSNSWMDLGGYAGVGDDGGTIELNQKKRRKLALNVILPKIYAVLGLTAGVNSDRTTEIKVIIGKAYMRKLRRAEISDYITKLDNSKPMKQAFNAGNLVLIVGDCVIENMSVSIKLDEINSAALDAKLGSANSKVFNDAALTVNIEKTTNGVYNFKVEHPVIFARLAKKQSSAGYLGDKADKDWNDWSNYSLVFDPSANR